MKITISCFIFLFLVAGVTAQEVQTKDHHTQANIAVTENHTISSPKKVLKSENSAVEDGICYSEISKVTFYEALIHQNNFEIHLKESNNLTLKNTEDIINNHKERVSYTD